MTLRRTLLLAAILSVAPTAMVMAQTPPPPEPQNEQAAPSRSPSNTSPEATNPSTTDPSAASSPHQRETTHMASKQSMKDCIAKQQTDNSGMSKADAKKACKAQMKGPG
jgi:hypothetical protein